MLPAVFPAGQVRRKKRRFKLHLFLPQAYINEAQKRGLTEKDIAMKREETLHPRPLPFSFDRPDPLSGTV